MVRESKTQIKVIRVDEAPVLFAVMDKLQIAEILDSLMRQHGNWVGDLSAGEVISGWLVFVLSTNDHRMNQVEEWVERRQQMYELCLGHKIRGLDFSDDRLGVLLDKLSGAELWNTFEAQLNQHMIRVYELESEQVRLDATTISTYAAVNEAGLLQLGHSKDGRPEDAQWPLRGPLLKIQLALLDPLGLPLATQVVAGNSADDPLYLPAIRQVQASLGVGGKTYIGDVKMAALETRASLVDSQDYYLCPLGEKQLSEAERAILIAAAVNGKVKLTPIKRERRSLVTNELLKREEIACGYASWAEVTAVMNGTLVRWRERRFVVQSFAFAKAEARQLDKRLAQAQTRLSDLPHRRQGKRRLTIEQARATAAQIISDCRVEGLVSVAIHRARLVRRDNSRSELGSKQPREEFTVTIMCNQHRITALKERKVAVLGAMGWRVYATNQPHLTLSQAVLAYREQYRIEDGISRLKGRPLGLTPMFLQTESRMIGLIHLLTIALRLLTIIEFPVRRQLASKHTTLSGLYAGQKGRRTSRPSSELLLKAFHGIDLVVGHVKEQALSFVTPLSETQLQVLRLLGLHPHLYDHLLSQTHL